MDLKRFVLCLWGTFINKILPCQSLIFQQDTFAKLQSPKLLLAIVLEEKEEDSASRCLVECYIHAQCTGVKVQRQGNTWNCCLVTTNITMVNEKVLPFTEETSSFDFYYVTDTTNRGAALVMGSPVYDYWPSSPFSYREDYWNNGRLTGIRVWYRVKHAADIIHGIHVRFGRVWSPRQGADTGSLGELLLAENETISFIRYRVGLQRTHGIEFTTSSGTVHGPWGSPLNNVKALQVNELYWISGGTAAVTINAEIFETIRPIRFFYKP